ADTACRAGDGSPPPCVRHALTPILTKPSLPMPARCIAPRSLRRRARPAFAPAADGSRRSGLQDAPKGRTFHMARRAARSGVPQPVAHGRQLTDSSVELLRLGGELRTIDPRA